MNILNLIYKHDNTWYKNIYSETDQSYNIDPVVIEFPCTILWIDFNNKVTIVEF